MKSATPVFVCLPLCLLVSSLALAQPHDRSTASAVKRADLSGHWRIDKGPKGSVRLKGREAGAEADTYTVTFYLPDGKRLVRKGQFDGKRLTLISASTPTLPAGHAPGATGALEGSAGGGSARRGAQSATKSVSYVLSSSRLKRTFHRTIPTQALTAEGQGVHPARRFHRADVSVAIHRKDAPAGTPLDVGKRAEFRLSLRPGGGGGTTWSCDTPGVKLKARGKDDLNVRVKASQSGTITLKARFKSDLGSKHYAELKVQVRPQIETVKIVAVTFSSDHGLLKDNDTTWKNAGKAFPEPEWTPSEQHPISHTMGESVRVTLQLEVGPKGATPVEGELLGRGPNGLKFRKKGVTFAPGTMSVTLDSGSTELAERVQKLNLALTWSVDDVGTLDRIGTTSNTVYVTMNTPQTPTRNPGITLKRMKKAVAAVGGAISTDPRKIVKAVISKWNRYNLQVKYPNAWELGEDRKDPTTGALIGADCQTIVRFTQNVIKMVGCPGTSEYVVVYAQVKKPKKGIVSVNAQNHMTAPYQWYNEHNTADKKRDTWIAILVDKSGGLNNYEAALRFTYKGKRYYPGGVNAVFSNPDQVIGVFTTMSWVDLFDLKAGTKQHIFSYRTGR